MAFLNGKYTCFDASVTINSVADGSAVGDKLVWNGSEWITEAEYNESLENDDE